MTRKFKVKRLMAYFMSLVIAFSAFFIDASPFCLSKTASAANSISFNYTGTGMTTSSSYYLTVNGTTIKAGTTFYTYNSTGSDKTTTGASGYTYVKVGNSYINVSGWQCLAYARYIQYLLYGSHEMSSNNNFVKVSSASGATATAANIKSWIYQAGVGAHIRSYYANYTNQFHSLVVIGINDNGFYFSDVNAVQPNIVRIGYYTWSGFANSNYKRIHNIWYIPGSSVNNPPIGALDTVTNPSSGTIRVTGWAFDPDNTSQSIDVHIYIGGPAGGGEGHAITANTIRTDVNDVFGCGTMHGFDATFKTSKTGTQAVYMYAIDSSGAGPNPLISTKSVTITAHTHNYNGGVKVYENAHPHAISQRCVDYDTCGGWYWTGEYYTDRECSQCWNAKLTSSKSSFTLNVNESATADVTLSGVYPSAAALHVDYDSSIVSYNLQSGKLTLKGLKAGSTTFTLSVYSKDRSLSGAVLLAKVSMPVTVNACSTHSGTWTTTKAATCTAAGTKTRTCTVCGKVETASIPALGHNYVNTVTAPTCTAQGYTTHTCSRCQNSYKDNYTASLGHNYIATVIQPTVSSDGYTLHKCSRCGYSYKDTYTHFVLAPVSNLKIGSTAKTALRLNWDKNADADGYIIEQLVGKKWTRLTKLTTNATTTYRVVGLAPATAYKFRVQAYKLNSGKAVYSEYAEISGTTDMSGVSGLKIGGTATNALRLNWSKNTNADGYIIEQLVGKKWTRLTKLTTNATTTYRVTGLKPGTAYKFRVQAYKISNGQAAYSEYAEVSGTTDMSGVSGLVIGGKAKTALRLNWDKNADADGYIIEQYIDGKWTRVTKITKNTTLTYRISGLKSATTYKFRIQAYKLDGKTAVYSDYATVSGKTT